MDHIRENIIQLNEKIRRILPKDVACENEVLLVAVTKTRSSAEINLAIDAGITDIGENKVQEILDKYEKVKSVHWHMIGHLQTNKVKYIIDKVKMIHSVDTFKLAEEINKRADQAGLTMDVLVQINAAKEESKFGISAEESENLIYEILKNCPCIRIKGLMSIAPFENNPEEVRRYFKQVRLLYDRFSKISDKNLDFEYLSMGMSNDYEVAISEGSNLIRIGTAIFGDRNYQL